MRTKVQRLPKNAVYDYQSMTGGFIYHTERRVYEVFERNHFGRKKVTIYSEPNKKL